MKNRIGIWIDHRKAVVVAMTAHGDTTALVVSKVEKHLQRAGDSPQRGKHEARLVPADDRRQRALTQHLNVYYDAVIATLRDAETVAVFGPGEAKLELKKRMVRAKLGGLLRSVDTVDKLTDRQIVARVHKIYAEEA